MGKTPSRDDRSNWGGCLKWASIADLGNSDKFLIDTKEKISQKAVDASGIKIVPANTVVMSFKLSVGKVAIVTEPLYTNEAIMAFVDIGRCACYPCYLYHQLRAKQWGNTGNRAVLGVTLNKKILSDVEIDLHPLPTQRVIAEELDRICELKRTAEKLVEKYRLLIKAKFSEMFGEGKFEKRALSQSVEEMFILKSVSL